MWNLGIQSAMEIWMEQLDKLITVGMNIYIKDKIILYLILKWTKEWLCWKVYGNINVKQCSCFSVPNSKIVMILIKHVTQF